MRAALAGMGLTLAVLAVFLALGRRDERGGTGVAEALPGAAAHERTLQGELSAPALPAQADSPLRAAAVEHEPAPMPAAVAASADAATELVVRLLDADGAPLAEHEVTVKLDGTWIAHTDRAGRLAIALSAARRAKQPRILFLRSRPDGLGARIPLAGLLEPGRVDLGGFTLAPVPVLVSGIVLKPDRTPCEKASVEINLFDATGSRGDRNRLLTAQDGGFELREWADVAWLEVSVRDSSGVSVIGRRVAPGTTGVVFALEEGGYIAGTVLFDDSAVIAPVLRCVIAASDGSVVQAFRGDGTLHLGRLRAGAYSVSVMLDGHPEPLATVAGIEVPNGEEVSPPGLNPLDLRGKLRQIVIDVTDHGLAPSDLEVRYRAAGTGDDAWTSQRDRSFSASLKLWTVAEALDIELAAPGYRTIRLFGVTSDAHVDLRPAHPVVVLLRDPPRLPPGCSLHARLRAATGPRASVDAPVKDSSARLSAAAPGEHEVVIQISCSHGQVRLPTEITPEPRVITVLDRDDEQVFVVTLDAARLDAALRQAR